MMDYYPAVKKNEMKFSGEWMELAMTLSNEIMQPQKTEVTHHNPSVVPSSKSSGETT